MAPPCPQCVSRLFCTIHHARPENPPPPVTPQPKTVVPSSFIFYQPSAPITLSRPISEFTRGEVRALAEKARSLYVYDISILILRSLLVMQHSSPTSSKRPVDGIDTDNDQNIPGPAKRARENVSEVDAVVLPPTISATIPAGPNTTSTQQRPRRVACECWNFMTGCETEETPVGIPRAELVTADIADLESRVFRLCRRPQSTTRIRCLLCWILYGRWKTWVNNDGLTNRIREHLEKHHPQEYHDKCEQEGVTVPTLNFTSSEDDTSDLVFSPGLLAEYLAQWAAIDDQAMRVVDRYEFRRVLLLCSRAPNLRDSDIPHRTKLTTVTTELYEAEMTRIKNELNKTLGFVSVTSDLWSDEKLRSFMAVTVHYINSLGDLSEHLLAFRRIEGRHTGVNVGHALYGIFEDANLIDRIGHITLDNASNNDTLMAELERAFIDKGHPLDRKLNRIRCFPHVINLAVQALLDALPGVARQFREEADDQGIQFNPELDKDFLDYLRAMESDPVGVCRDSVNAMRSSDLRREGLQVTILDGNRQQLFKTLYGEVLFVSKLELLRDSKTRWSSTYMMILRYLMLYPAIKLFVRRNPSMSIPIISDKQYEVLQDICSILSVLHHAQELLSAEKTPTLALALPVYEALIDALDNCISESKFPELSYAIKCAIHKLEAYVAKARNLPVYTLAMVINPALKFTWIDQHKGPVKGQEARVTAKNAMYEVRRRQPVLSTTPGQQAPSHAATHSQSRGYARLLTVSKTISRASEATRDSHNSTQPKPDGPTPKPLSSKELTSVYMADVEAELLRWEQYKWAGNDTMGTVNLVEFWKAHRNIFPLLYQIAMNVLPVQASSVSSERAFSSSKMTCTRERNSISAEHMEYLQVLKHSLHRRRANHENNQTLNFMAHVVDPDDEETIE
ncbi:unnamed protein product [Rhizoctonia solani]|uniref:HAT C-terminal dimerisation domain-containing protein n=1 Tax=Rhizoctonia solani TaxID=456999 RepID=A0A8H3AUV8_9AGAM|nr:unnamed protein product [Rhizoctonia solani]CAE6441093.1 unnamed protein product [Rhizoctonia solani]